MKKSALNKIKIASPCSADWDEMLGDKRKRFCSLCQLNVYNISEMTEQEAKNFLFEAEGRVCVRLYKRADGTVITQDCPVGWAMIKCNVSRVATAVFSLVAGIWTGVYAVSQFRFDNQKLLQEVSLKLEESQKTQEGLLIENEKPVIQRLKPKKERKKPNYQAVNGRISNIRDLQDEPVELWIK